MSVLNADEVPERPADVSDRKARANAENARRSTGPQTFDGKQRSSMNALKHGGFANRSVAIPAGHVRRGSRRARVLHRGHHRIACAT